MNQLDGDETPLFSQNLNKFVARDIVQFVPFNKFAHNPTLLAKEVLNEVPRQVLEYFGQQRIMPNARSI